MRLLGAVVAVLLVFTGVVGLTLLGRAQAQPMGPMPMQGPMPKQGGEMTSQQMNAMMAQMQAHMAQMNASVKTLRQQLDKINPELLTGQERPIYEYLKLLQTHLETMNAMLGSMQGMIMQMRR